MSIIVALTISIFIWHGAMAIARLIVDAIATVLGVMLFARTARVERRLLAMCAEPGANDVDHQPSRAERRLMAAGLRLAIRQIEMRSLFPHIGSHCDRLAAAEILLH